jgi:hypothetical protein
MSTNTYTFKIVGNDKTSKMFKSINANIITTIKSGGKLAALFGVGLAAGIAVMTKKQMGVIDNLAKMSDRLNIATEDLASFHHMTQLNGQSSENFDKSLEKMTRAVGEAQRGLGTAKPAFEQLGLSIDELGKMDAKEQFLTIAESINKMSDQTEKASLAADIFGRSGVGLLNTLDQGREGFEAARVEAERLGIAISRVDAYKVEMANDSMLRLNQVATGFSQQLAVELAPIIEVIADKLTGAATEGNNMGNVVKAVFTGGAKVAGFFADTIYGIKIVIKGIQVVFKGLMVGMNSGLLGVIDTVLLVRNKLIDGLVWPIRKTLELLSPFSDSAANALKNIDQMVSAVQVRVPEGMKAYVKAQAESFDQAKQDLVDLLASDLPSDVLKANIDKVLAEADIKAQEAVAKIKAKITTGQGQTPDAPHVDPLAAEREKLAAKVALLGEYQNIELLQLNQKELDEQALLYDAYQKKAIDKEKYEQKMTDLESFYSNQRQAIKLKEFNVVAGQTAGFFNDVISVTTKNQDKMFKRQKMVSLAHAMVTLPTAILETYKNSGGYPMGIGPAIAMGAKGLAQIMNIKKQNVGSSSSISVGGGSSSSSSPTSTPSSNISNLPVVDSATNNPGKSIVIQVSGDVVSDSQSMGDWLINKIKPQINENDAVLIDNPNSAQAQLLGA